MDYLLACQISMAVQLALLLLHQMDSTYFREWEILPLRRMGYTSFFVVTAALAALQVGGLALLLFRLPAGSIAAAAWGLIGLIVPAFHTYHYGKGTRGFRNFWSAAVIYATAVNSALLIIFALGALLG